MRYLADHVPFGLSNHGLINVFSDIALAFRIGNRLIDEGTVGCTPFLLYFTYTYLSRVQRYIVSVSRIEILVGKEDIKGGLIIFSRVE